MLRYAKIPSILTLVRVSITKGNWILSNVSSAFIKCWSCGFYYFCWVIGVCHIDWFVYVELSLLPRDELNLIVVYDLFMCCWIHFANILLRIFAPWYSSKIFLFGSVFVWFGIRVMVAFSYKTGDFGRQFFPFQSFGRLGEGDDILFIAIKFWF